MFMAIFFAADRLKNSFVSGAAYHKMCNIDSVMELEKIEVELSAIS